MRPQKINLLVVDEQAADRKRMLSAVKRSGLQCDLSEAAVVAEALAAYDKRRFDCVILDYSRPDEDGLQAITSLLQRLPFLPVITSTDKGNERLAAEALKVGAMDYVTKADITPAVIRRAIEGAMQRADAKRMQADQYEALTRFARVLVHDLKAPTQSMLGFAKLAEAFLSDEHYDRPKALAQCRRIGEGVMRMNGLLDSLHAYTEADAHLGIESVSMQNLVRGVVAGLDETIRTRGASIRFEHLPTVSGDQAQLAQLVQNLVANAIKFCRADRPEVRIAAERQDNGIWRFEVRDNGIGIPESEQVAIFEPFRRLHSSSHYEGTGLGLATCKKIVERHGGAIWCASGEGQGTSFYFTLPSAQRGTGGAPPSPAPAAARRKGVAAG